MKIDGKMYGCFYKTDGLLMGWCMVALQDRRTIIIDGNMYDCFTKEKDYRSKYEWLL